MADPSLPGELPPPPEAEGGKDASELLRAWIVDAGLQVSMHVGFEDPATWGVLLVDIARHASRAYAAEGQFTEADAMERIRKMWMAEVTSPTDLGTTERHG
jgi:Domain of unknown function (DUF5076)